jgi:hypothetical protein
MNAARSMCGVRGAEAGASCAKMHDDLLAPICINACPASLRDAVKQYTRHATLGAVASESLSRVTWNGSCPGRRAREFPITRFRSTALTCRHSPGDAMLPLDASAAGNQHRHAVGATLRVSA